MNQVISRPTPDKKRLIHQKYIKSILFFHYDSCFFCHHPINYAYALSLKYKKQKGYLLFWQQSVLS